MVDVLSNLWRNILISILTLVCVKRVDDVYFMGFLICFIYSSIHLSICLFICLSILVYVCVGGGYVCACACVCVCMCGIGNICL